MVGGLIDGGVERHSELGNVLVGTVAMSEKVLQKKCTPKDLYIEMR